MVFFVLVGVQPGEGQAPPQLKKEKKTGPKKEFKDMKGGIAVASDANEQIRLVWVPPGAKWAKGGWRLEEAESGRVVRDRVTPGQDAEAVASLTEEDREGLKSLNELFGGTIGKDTEITYFVFVSRVTSEWLYARAAGLAVLLKDVPAGRRSYRVVGLDENGKSMNVALTTTHVDSSVASLLPLPPAGLKAESKPEGVALLWQPPPGEVGRYATTYYIERQAAGQKIIPLTKKPTVYGKQWDPAKPAFVDSTAPVEIEVTYRVSSIDVFGRKSRPAILKFFVPDQAALRPPLVTVKAGEGIVRLSWQQSKNPNTTGYIVERSFLFKGPYEVLTAKALPGNATGYEDRNVLGGTAYYYRVRSVDVRGKFGTPSTPAMGQATNKEEPPKPEGLKADVGRTRVRLTWQPVKVPVAGYMVERKAEGAERWIQLNGRVTPEALYDDYFPLHTSGSFSYHVKAVAFDNKEGEPGAVVQVTLRDTLSPNPPYITGIDGKDGRVVLTFMASPPEKDVSLFLVVRGVSEDDPGLVMGDPIPVSRGKFEDTFVKVGQRYWYRVVAADKSGNRSDPSEARHVSVMNPPIPVPGKPAVKYGKEPVGHVTIGFEKSPSNLSVLVQRRGAADDQWHTVIGPVAEATEVADMDLPLKGRIAYRILYQAENGVLGAPSEVVEVVR